MSPAIKSPIGVMPERIWRDWGAHLPPRQRDAVRAQELLEAVFRYRAAGLVPRPEWFEEWAEILTRSLRMD